MSPQSAMLPALRRLRPGPGLRRPPGARSCRAAAAALSRDNEQRCRALLEASARRYRLEAATAAVLVPLCRAGGQPALLYTLRSRSLRGRHKGDVRYLRRWRVVPRPSPRARGAAAPLPGCPRPALPLLLGCCAALLRSLVWLLQFPGWEAGQLGSGHGGHSAEGDIGGAGPTFGK